MKLLDIQNHNSFTGYEMTETAVTKQPKKKFGYETTEITGTN